MREVTKPVFCRFSELSPATVNVEYQVHTTWTDGKASSGEILAEARARSLGAIAFTEHVRRETEWFRDFAEEIRAHRESYPEMNIYLGAETKALDEDGELDISPEVLAASEIVLGVVHRFPGANGGYLDFRSLSAGETAEIEFRLSMGMIRHAPIDVLGHPGGMFQRRHGSFPRELFREMMLATRERGIAIEINSSYLVDLPGFLALCAEIDPFVSIGSDAHRLQELAVCRDRLVEMGIGAS